MFVKCIIAPYLVATEDLCSSSDVFTLTVLLNPTVTALLDTLIASKLLNLIVLQLDWSIHRSFAAMSPCDAL